MQMPMRELDENENQNSHESGASSVVFHADDVMKKASCILPGSPSSSASASSSGRFGDQLRHVDAFRQPRAVVPPPPPPPPSPPENQTHEEDEWGDFLNMTASVLALTSTSEDPTMPSKSTSAASASGPISAPSALRFAMHQIHQPQNMDPLTNQNAADDGDSPSNALRNRVRRHSLSEPFVMNEENPWRPLGRRATLTPQASSHQKEARLRANSYAAFSSAELGNLGLNLGRAPSSSTNDHSSSNNDLVTNTTSANSDGNDPGAALSYSSADSCHSESSNPNLSLVEEQREDLMVEPTNASSPNLELRLDLDDSFESASSSQSQSAATSRHPQRNRLHLSLQLEPPSQEEDASSSSLAPVVHPRSRSDLEFMDDSGDDEFAPLGGTKDLSSSRGSERMSPKLFHVKSPVLGNRRDSQTWQLQEEELLGSPRFRSASSSSPSRRRASDEALRREEQESLDVYPGVVRHLSDDSGQLRSMEASMAMATSNSSAQFVETRTKDMRAASIDFSAFRTPSPSINPNQPPLPPPQDHPSLSGGRSRARSFSYSTSSYGASSSSYSSLMDVHRQRGSPWNGINKPILRPPHPHELQHQLQHQHLPPPPPQSASPRLETRTRSASSSMTFSVRERVNSDDVLINDVRKLSIEIPHPPHSPRQFAPMPPYSQYASQAPPPGRRYSGDGAFVMSPFSEHPFPSAAGEYEQMSRGATRGMRSYSMECMNYPPNRGGVAGQPPPHEGGPIYHHHTPPPCEPPAIFPRPTNSNGGGGFDWPRPMMENSPVSPPLPPDSRPAANSGYRNVNVNAPPYPPYAPPEAYYEVEFKRGRQELFSGKGSFNPGDFVKVEADRGEDIGRIVKRIGNDGLGVRAGGSVSGGGGGHQGACGANGEPLGSMAPLPPPPQDDVGGAVVVTPSSSSKQRHDVKRILCLASVKECEMLDQQRREESEVFEVCKSKVRQRLLPMNVIDAEYQFDRHKLTFFFEADRRIDFRELVRDLFAIYKTRIWLQQVVSSNRKATATTPCAPVPTTTAAPANVAPSASGPSSGAMLGGNGGCGSSGPGEHNATAAH